MAARQRVKQIAFWTAIAIPLLAALYLGAYYRMLAFTTVVMISTPQNRPTVQRQPRYILPWPIPAQYNDSELQPGLQHAFAPAHRVDQWLRPDVWAGQEVKLQVQTNGNGSGDLIMIDTTTKPF